MINNFVALFGGFHRFDNGGSKAVVLQFVDPFDCDSEMCIRDRYTGAYEVELIPDPKHTTSLSKKNQAFLAPVFTPA